MKYRTVRLVVFFGVLITFLHAVLFALSRERQKIVADLKRWTEVKELETSLRTSYQQLVFFLVAYPEFRNLFYYRITRSQNPLVFGIVFLVKIYLPPISTLLIWVPEIGPGLFIQHGFATVITAEKIGANCWINQQVTIGYADNLRPCIGNDVRIAAGAKVLGGIEVGDHCIVGANAVVVKNVPPNCTVVGVPAYIIRRDGVRVRENLE